MPGSPGRSPRVEGKDWLDADGYLWRHLASHAAAGRVLDALVTDPGYLAAADPIRLVPALATLADGRAREIADVYGRIAHELPMAEPLERMALIHLVACQEAPALAPNLELPLPTAWRCRWARWKPSAPNRILGRHTGRCTRWRWAKWMASRWWSPEARTTRCDSGMRAPANLAASP